MGGDTYNYKASDESNRSNMVIEQQKQLMFNQYGERVNSETKNLVQHEMYIPKEG